MGTDRIATRCLAALLPVIILIVACSTALEGQTPEPAHTFVLPTAPPESDPSPPPVTIPSGFVFPVPGPLNEGNADDYSWKALFERTGCLSFRHVDAEPAGEIDRDGQAARLAGDEGLLEDGYSYVGSLPDALAAFDLTPTGIVTRNVAYGIGQITAERADPNLPEGSVWAPRLERFHLADGRTGWAMTGDWTAVVDRDCMRGGSSP